MRPSPPSATLTDDRFEASVRLLVDPQVGIVEYVREVPIEPGDPDLFHYAARAADTSAFTDQKNFASTGGVATTRKRAIGKAVGEAVERYSSALYERGELPIASADDAPFPTVDPLAFALHSPAQYDEPGFPWAPFGRDTPVRWTPARDAATGELAYLPAAMVWMPYDYERGSDETPIVEPISTGLAAHGDLTRATLSGVCEAIERDAFMLFWQARLALPQIRIETLGDDNYDIVARLQAGGDRVILLDATLDLGVPTAIAILKSDAPDRPAHAFAASTEPDPEMAVRKTLEELAHTRRYSARVHRQMPPIPNDDPGWESVVTQLDHLNFAADHEKLEYFTFVTASKKRIDFEDMPSLSTGDPSRDLDAVLERLARAGLRAYVADLTSDDVRAAGMCVVRVVVPGLHPLFMGHRLRALGGTRLFTVPQRLGYPGIEPGGPDNPAPHPFP